MCQSEIVIVHIPYTMLFSYILRVFGVPLDVVVYQLLKCPKKKRARSAGNIDDLQFRNLFRSLPLDELSNCVLYNVIDDILRGIIDTACFSNLRFFFNTDLLLRETDRLAQKPLVDAPQNLNADFIKVVRGERVVDVLEDLLKDLVPHFQLFALVLGKEQAVVQ